MASYQTTVVAFGDLKNAALYFDHLIPVYLAVELLSDKLEWDSLVGQGARDLLPAALRDRPDFTQQLSEVNLATLNLLLKFTIQHFGLKPQIKGISEEEYAVLEDRAASEYFRFIDEYGLRDYPLASGAGPATAWMGDDDDSASSPVVTLTDLKLVDASKVPWEQIFEFRRDLQARDRLRRLRLFAYDNYAGRSRAYIEDDILTRVSQYEETVRQWGLEAVQGALSVVLNSKLTASVIAGSLLSSLFGQPITTLIATGAGTVVELGHIGVDSVVSVSPFVNSYVIAQSRLSLIRGRSSRPMRAPIFN